MNERFPSAAAGPEREMKGPAQEDVDALFLKLAGYEPTGDEMARVVHALLAQEGLELTEEAIAKGGEEVDGIPRDVSVEFEGVGQDGTFHFEVTVRDRFNRTSGETLRFGKWYRLKASAQALERRRAAQEEEARTYEAARAERGRKLHAALEVFRPFAAAHLDQTLTGEAWDKEAHGLRGLFLSDGIPAGGSWTITQEEGDRLRVTVKDAKGSVYDVYEFTPED